MSDASAPVDPLGAFTSETFAPHHGSSFELSVAADAVVTLELVEVTQVAEQPFPGGTRSPFSLSFRGPAAPLLGQGSYRCAHPELGVFDLFVVPRGADADGVSYEAPFA